MTETKDTPSFDRKQLALAGIMLFWFIVVTGVILWQTVAYRGIAAYAAEWQFQVLGQYFPWATLLLLIGLFSLPPIYFLFRREQPAENHIPTLSEVQERGRRYHRQLTISAIACLAAALVSFALVLTLPSATGQPVRIDATAGATPRSGPTILAGRIRYDRVATFDRHLLLAERTVYFAPVESVSGSSLRYFVEFADLPSANTVTAVHQGVLRSGGLPGEIMHLYRDAGYSVGEPLYVLFSSETSMRWPFYVIGLHFLLVAMVLGGAAFFQRRRVLLMPHRWRNSGAGV